MSARPNTSQQRRSRPRVLGATLVGLVLALLATLSGGTPVSAHTAFVGSDPADGSVVEQPVSEITIEFTGAAEEAGDGFQVLDPGGVVRTPSSVTVVDDRIFTLAFEPALESGVIGVRWTVRAGDAHPISGSFSFTVAGTPTTTAPVPTTTSAGSTPSTIPGTSVAPGPQETLPTESDDMAAMGADDISSATPAGTSELDDFLRVDENLPGETTADVGRLIGIPSIVLVLGVLAFAATTMRGTRGEIGGLIRAVRVIGVVAVVGSVIEYVGVARLAGDALTSAWSSSAGAATLMRAAAGAAIAAGVGTTIVRVRSRAARPLSSATYTDTTTGASDLAATTDTVDVHRWRADRSSWPAALGAVLAITSFWFDGHTVTEGFRPAHALANSLHVTAGAVWVGGVVSIAVVMWTRHRRQQPSGAAELVVRFSSIATVALGAVAGAGVLMAVAILDSFGELTSTPWGQTLLLKSAAVAVAAAIGAYNHFRLKPALERDPADTSLHDAVRSTVTAEAIILGFVLVATSALVAAAI